MNTLVEDSTAFTPPAVVKPREWKVARQLARCAPGLGHIYAGDIVRGLLFLAAVDVPMIFGSLLLVAPWGNLWVAGGLVLTSFILSTWAIRDTRKVVLSTRADYRMKDYNHWAAYLIIGIVPTVATAMAAALAIISTVSRAFSAGDDLPAIGISKGDLFVEWRRAYDSQSPRVGDLIVYRSALSKAHNLLGQISGLPGDTVTTSSGANLVPPGSLAVKHKEEDGGELIIAETAITGELVFRFWPPQRIGSVMPPGDKKP